MQINNTVDWEAIRRRSIEQGELEVPGGPSSPINSVDLNKTLRRLSEAHLGDASSDTEVNNLSQLTKNLTIHKNSLLSRATSNHQLATRNHQSAKPSLHSIIFIRRGRHGANGGSCAKTRENSDV